MVRVFKNIEDGATTILGDYEIKSEDGWTLSLTGLDAFDGKKTISYSVKELKKVGEAKYEVIDDKGIYNSDYNYVEYSEENGVEIITNKHTPETTDLSIKKIFDK